MEDVKHIIEPEMEGQTTLPGFGDPEPTPPESEKIKKGIGRVSFVMSMLRDPEDAFATWPGVPEGVLSRYLETRFNSYVHAVALATGADPAQIADKDTRTPEQQRLLQEEAAKETIARLDAFFESRYMQAINVLEPMQGIYPDPAAVDFYTDHDLAQTASGIASVKEQAVLYFFAKYPDAFPPGADPLTNEQKEELRGIYTRLDAFYMERTNGGEINPPGAEILYAFIERENPTPETAESIVEKLATVQGLTPSAHTMPNTRLMNALQQDGLINTDAVQLIVSSGKNRRKEITAYTMISYDPGDTGIEITKANLTEHERQVSDAVVSLWIEATQRNLPTIFTVDQIFRAMPGGSDKASPQQRGAITKAMEKFSRLHIYMDATEEMRRRGNIAADQKFIIDENYLLWRRLSVETKNGKKIAQAYQIASQPIMLTYSKLTNQLLTVPAKNIAIEKVKQGKPSGELIAMSADRQAMTGYIVRRLAVMKYQHEKAKDAKRKYDAQRRKDPTLEEKPVAAFMGVSLTISFETLFKETGVSTSDRKQTMDNRNFCFSVLDYQQAIGYIRGYEKQTKGRSITGVKIQF